MIQSMTGYGKAEATLSSGKLTLEIRTLNGKSADINIKSSLLPKEKDLEVRKLLADKLVRGTIDLYISFEPAAGEGTYGINAEAFHAYWKSVVSALDKETIFTKTFLKDPGVGSILASSILRLPEVVDARKGDVIAPEEWPLVASALESALAQLMAYRANEGKALYADVTSRPRFFSVQISMQRSGEFFCDSFAYVFPGVIRVREDDYSPFVICPFDKHPRLPADTEPVRLNSVRVHCPLHSRRIISALDYDDLTDLLAGIAFLNI